MRDRKSKKSKVTPSPPPPGTVLRLIRTSKIWPHSATDIGKLFIVDYYSKLHGLEEVMLSDEEGKYQDSIHFTLLEEHFEIVKKGVDEDFFGDKVFV